MTRVVFNACFCGFSLSHKAAMRYAEIKGITLYPRVDDRGEDGQRTGRTRAATEGDIKAERMVFYYTTPNCEDDSHWSCRDIERDDPALVQVVEELGDAANGMCAALRVEDVPKGSLYRIDEYDGRESVMTQNEYDWKLSS